MYSTRSKLDYYGEENNVFKDMAVEKENGAPQPSGRGFRWWRLQKPGLDIVL